MRFFFLFLFLVVFTPIASIAEWFECTLTNRFEPLTQLSIRSLPEYHKLCVPYFVARGVNDEAIIENLVREDILNIEHALNVLFEQDQKKILRNFLGEYFFLIEGYNAQIDHVGRELLGPLSFYLPFLEEISSQLDLTYLRKLTFPSTQVVKVLKQYDPDLQGVTIGRIYFQSPDRLQIGCIELFQAAPQDEKNPQGIEATQERLFLLTNVKSNSIMSPIDHLSIELSSVEEVEQIHTRIHELRSEILMPNQEEVSWNPGDGSTQTKVLMRDSSKTSFNRIIEFVHYAKQR